jgi:aminoglycoside/choline kinase family phosphotransferase
MAGSKTNEEIEKALQSLYRKAFGKVPEIFIPLRSDGSARKIYRLGNPGRIVVGIYGPDPLENRAFLEFSMYFKKHGLPVPEIYAEDTEAGVYLEEDLGDVTLFSRIEQENKDGVLSESLSKTYRKVLDILPRFQEQVKAGMDLTHCYPRAAFDRQSIMWDLNYFKYYFLKLAPIPFNEQKLEDDFVRFADFLMEAPQDYFLYRDFQSRNIMLRDGEPWFIDYQGGRRGARHYDLASLLYDAKANLSPETRNDLRDYYINAAGVDRRDFLQHYPAFAYVRIMQAMGAYGLRGFYERKPHFLKSVPFAVRNIEWLLNNTEIPEHLPELMACFRRITMSVRLRQFGNTKLGLTVRIGSFSYKNGIPLDDHGHGGGFVFDCRALPNPGRYPQYSKKDGRDKPVIEFLDKEADVEAYLSSVYALVDASVKNYLERNFTSLMVHFGCTGGQHRSVYCAEHLAAHLKEKFGVRIELSHRELEKK